MLKSNRAVDVDKSKVTETIVKENQPESTQRDAEYRIAMQSYLSRPDYLLTDPSQKYPQREYSRVLKFLQLPDKQLTSNNNNNAGATTPTALPPP